MSEHLGILDSATGDWDEGGFYLTLGTDEGEGTVRITNHETARALLKALEELVDWVNEADEARASYVPHHEQELVDFGDFNSDDPFERYQAHQRAKGRA